MSTTTLDKRVHDFVSTPRQLFIDGQLVDAKSGKTFETLQPGDRRACWPPLPRRLRGHRPCGSGGRDGPSTTALEPMTPSERGRIIWRIGDLISEHLEEFAELETLDNGKPLAVARAADVPLAADCSGTWQVGRPRSRETRLPCPSIRARRGVPRLHPARAGRRRRADHPVELPAADGRLEDRAGLGDRHHRDPQAGRADPVVGSIWPRSWPRRAFPTGWSTLSPVSARPPARRSPPTKASTRSPSPAPPRSAG